MATVATPAVFHKIQTLRQDRKVILLCKEYTLQQVGVGLGPGSHRDKPSCVIMMALTVKDLRQQAGPGRSTSWPGQTARPGGPGPGAGLAPAAEPATGSLSDSPAESPGGLRLRRAESVTRRFSDWQRDRAAAAGRRLELGDFGHWQATNLNHC